LTPGLQEKNAEKEKRPGPGAYSISLDTLANRSIIKYTEGIMAMHIQKSREEQKRLREIYIRKRQEAAFAEMNLQEIERS